MKTRHLFLLLFLSLIVTATVAQSPPKMVLKLKNNGVLPREFKFLERHPDTKELNVFTAYLLPGQSYTVALKAGTSLAQVTQPEINATMRGQNVPGKPLLVVKPTDDGRTIHLLSR